VGLGIVGLLIAWWFRCRCIFSSRVLAAQVLNCLICRLRHRSVCGAAFVDFYTMPAHLQERPIPGRCPWQCISPISICSILFCVLIIALNGGRSSQLKFLLEK